MLENQPARPTFTLKPEERLRRGLCVKCEKPRGKDGTSRMCRRHADRERARVAERRLLRINAGLCGTCGEPRGKDGTTNYCRRCADSHNARHAKRFLRLKNAGLCVRCSGPRGEGATSIYCRRCAGASAVSARDRHERLTAAGLCVWCGELRGKDGTETLCRRHADAIAANDRELYQQMIKSGLCPEHREPMRVLERCPACLYEASVLSASNFSFVGLLAPPPSGDGLETCVSCTRCVRVFHAGHPYQLPHLPRDLKLRDEHVGGEGCGLWLRFSRENEQGQVEIEYEACSLPDKRCVRWVTRKVALDFLRRHRAGDGVAGSCFKHTHDRGRLRRSAEAHIQQLAQIALKNGNDQKRRPGPDPRITEAAFRKAFKKLGAFAKQEDLAEEIGVSVRAIGFWLKDHNMKYREAQQRYAN